MFALFRPKMTVNEFAGIGARVIYKIAASNASADTETMKSQLISAGANEQALNLELAAFDFFCHWAGATRALQRANFPPKSLNS